MWLYADYSQVVEEVKERNRLFRALNEIKEIALLDPNREIPPEVEERFKLIAQKRDDALRHTLSTQGNLLP